MIVEVLAVSFAILVALPSVALAGLAIASLRRVRPLAGTPGHGPSIAVLIAAHDEEQAIEATLAAIRAIAPAVVVHVVADNCADRTAFRAALAGACVHERTDARRRGKAAALNDLIGEVLVEDRASAFVFLDADARPERGFFVAMRSTMARGAAAAQARNLVAASRAPLSQLRALAFHLRCELRAMAYDALGLSAGLHGNGMCLDRALLRRYRWDETSVVEDGELHLRLVRDGVRVAFVRGATVRSPMPESFGGAAGQAVRWERGKVDLFGPALALVRLAIRRRRIDAMAAALDVMIPPLSVLVAASILALVAGVLAQSAIAISIVILSLGCGGVYLARGFALARFHPAALLRIAAWAPAYVAWKVVVLARTVLGAGRGEWTQARSRVREVNG